MREPEISDDPLRVELRDALDRIDSRMETYENALIQGQMAPDAFVMVYRNCIEDRDYVIRKIAVHEAIDRSRDHGQDARTRTEAQDRTSAQLARSTAKAERDLAPGSRVETLSPADIRAAVRQSQQNDRPLPAAQDRVLDDQRERARADERDGWEQPGR